MKIKRSNILVTGGAGFIGSSLAQKLCDYGHHVVVADNLETGDFSKIPTSTNCSFIKCDVNNLSEIQPIMTSFKFDFVFHYAALVGVLRTLENPVKVLEDIQGIQNILSLSKATGVKKVFYSSSSEVYGEPVELPQHEHKTPLNSRLPYAVVKNVGEAFCRSYQQEYGLDFTIFRFFNTYGEKQSEDFVISKFFRCALKNEDITIYGDGSQTRTFCHIEDNLEATVKVFEENLFTNDVLNIGNDHLTTIIELAQVIIRLTDSKSKIIFLPPLKEGDMTRRQPDIGKMKKVLSRDFITLEEGIKELVKGIN
ncbi:NAD-dependent epimerase/dehydratase family protein [Ekhidna sp.]|uniref:NAD-dependent epimerase/dehydratase family protein n=1 Tax=Ekhidna sp. TaxID=2608089 RepID=UPI003B5154A8